MKKIFTTIISSILYALGACAQAAPYQATSDLVSASTEYVYPNPSQPMRWKDERVTQRREFYNARTAFDPSAEYPVLYDHSASPTMVAVTDRGTARLMDGSTHAQIAYYNNAIIGTVLKVTNPDNGKVTYAVVIGKMPPSDSASYKVKLSQKTARNINLKDYNTVEIACYTPALH
ncbi:MAG: hypothetical protein JST83_14460 [Bacteroidetes bacterium]|nr:hypothetical protein [Bacteroidota bacterium]